MPPNKDLQGQQLEQKSCPWTMQQKMSQLRQEQIQPLSKVCQQKYLIQLCTYPLELTIY